MITKEITAFGKQLVIGCDAKCEKAFGINGRPSIQVSPVEDDYAWLADHEVDIAPVSGLTHIVDEGGDRKPDPSIPASRLNKWCYRECERCVSATNNEDLVLRDFSERLFNLKQEAE